MAQPPYLLDVLQIEPGSGDTLTIARDSTAGAMEFVDAILTSGVLLPALVGLRNVTGLFVVGRAGDGAPYTTIQSAIDAIPVSSSATAPSVVLILSGVYTENLTLQRDGVCLVGGRWGHHREQWCLRHDHCQRGYRLDSSEHGVPRSHGN